MTCETCRFWNKPENATDGECRRYPPKIVSLMESDYDDCIETYVKSQFPTVKADDWCGEFKEYSK